MLGDISLAANIYIVTGLTPVRLLNKVDNAFVKREKIHLCRGEE